MDKKSMGKSMKIFFVTLCVAIMILVGIFVGGNYFFEYALDTHFSAVHNTSKNQDDEEWLYGKADDVFVTSNDGLKLHAFFVRQDNSMNDAGNVGDVSLGNLPDCTVILVHGYKSSVFSMMDFARHYYERGWNILLIEQRAHGSSEGRYIGMGALEQYDVLKWMDFILLQNPNTKIILHGLSMGAATTMLVTGNISLPENLVAAIEDCGYSSIVSEFSGQIKDRFGIPSFPILPVASLVSKIRAGFFFGVGNCIKAVSRSKIPTVFIHGDADTFVPFSMLDEIYEAASCDKQRLVVHGAEHAKSVEIAPEIYWQAVDEFVEKYVK